MRPDNFQWRVPVSREAPFHSRTSLVFFQAVMNVALSKCCALFCTLKGSCDLYIFNGSRDAAFRSCLERPDKGLICLPTRKTRQG